MKTKYTLAAMLGALALSGAAAHANTITPQALGFSPGVSITYGADLTSGELHAGDGFTIFDIGGFTGFGLLPASWTASFGGTLNPWGISPLGVDNPSLQNVTFTYNGEPFEVAFGAATYVPFVVNTTALTVGTDDWTSRDHNLGSPGSIDGSPSTPSRGQILVPVSAAASVSVPDGGATAAFLGIALIGLQGLRRKMGMA